MGADPVSEQKKKELAGKGTIILIGVYLLAVTLLLAWMLVDLWPANPQSLEVVLPTVTPTAQVTSSTAVTKTTEVIPTPIVTAPLTSTVEAKTEVKFLGGVLVVFLGLENRLLMIVLIAGALGSLIHLLGSFVDFVGNQKFARSWIAWYVLQPFVGSLLALTFYLVLRGGLVASSAGTGSINFYGIAAFSALTGMFTRQARDKLAEIFNVFFRVEKKDVRTDPLQDDKPPKNPPPPSNSGEGKV